jgi:hypothetical protein
MEQSHNPNESPSQNESGEDQSTNLKRHRLIDQDDRPPGRRNPRGRPRGSRAFRPGELRANFPYRGNRRGRARPNSQVDESRAKATLREIRPKNGDTITAFSSLGPTTIRSNSEYRKILSVTCPDNLNGVPCVFRICPSVVHICDLWVQVRLPPKTVEESDAHRSRTYVHFLVKCAMVALSMLPPAASIPWIQTIPPAATTTTVSMLMTTQIYVNSVLHSAGNIIEWTPLQ